MSDKEIIKHLKSVIEAQNGVIKAYEILLNTQKAPKLTITSGGKGTTYGAGV